jgi:hypothetical protein
VFRSSILKIKDIYRKNKDDFRALFGKQYPQFVYRPLPFLPAGEIAVFVFHTIDPDYLERQLLYLKENEYQTLNATEFLHTINGTRKAERNTVVLTFDDGRGSLWSIAYPLLKEYGMKAIAFVISGAVPDDEDVHPHLGQVKEGKIQSNEVLNREQESPLCNWQELHEMDLSGHVDVQSHTTYHNSVFVGSRIIDFVNPEYVPSFLCSTFNPVVRINNEDRYLEHLDWGFPVYTRGASMASDKRYIEDEKLTEHCIAHVSSNGGLDFFARRRWRKELFGIVDDYKEFYGCRGRYQTLEERKQEIKNDLLESRSIIEAKLGKEVSEWSTQLSSEVGYLANHWGIYGNNKVITRVGDDPYYISRMSDDYLFCLPGKQRKSVFTATKEKYARRLKLLVNNIGGSSPD